MRVRLIWPRSRILPHAGSTRLFPQINLPMLAALAPPDVQVEIVDEHLHPVARTRDVSGVDLVGITAITPVVNGRALYFPTQLRLFALDRKSALTAH